MYTSRVRSQAGLIVVLIVLIALLVGGTAHAFYGAMQSVVTERSVDITDSAGLLEP